MKVTYLNHSGFLLEWEHSYWLFDYYKGDIPVLNPSKDILVFCSHSHEDHFNPAIFTLLAKYPSVTFIFSNEMRKAYKKLQKSTTEQLPPVQFLKSRKFTFHNSFRRNFTDSHSTIYGLRLCILYRI